MESREIKERVEELYKKLYYSAATFVYKPDELEAIRAEIADLQSKCKHTFENGKCTICRKEQDNAN